MHFNKVEQGFSAILKTPEGKILEYGKGSIAPENSGVIFKNDFVPLFKMGTLLTIVRVHNDVEIQRFTGEVYLSSQKLLQLVSVQDEVLSSAASAFLYPTDLAASITADLQDPHSQTFFSRLLGHPKTKTQTVPVAIHAISLSQIRLSGTMPLAAQQRFTLDIPQLHVVQLPAQVELALDFGKEQNAPNYKCKILELSPSNRLQLQPFVETLSQKNNKLFPPIR